MSELERVIPQSMEAEVCVLGSMLLDVGALAYGREFLKPEDFMRPAHCLMFERLCSVDVKGFDLVTFDEHVKQAGLSERTGGRDYILALAEGVPNSANMEYYAKIVKDKATLRALMLLGGELSRDARDARESSADILARYQQRLFNLDDRAASNKREAMLGDAVLAVVKETDRRQTEGDTKTGGVMTGYPKFDAAMYGIRQGHLLTLAGSTSAGKSSLALSWSHNIGAAGGRVLYVSAEMPTNELAQRILQSRSRVWGSSIIKGSVDMEGWNRINEAEAALKNLKVYFVARAMTLAEIAVKSRELAIRWGGLDAVFIDYLGIMRLPPAREKRDSFGAMSSGLKQMAMEMGVGVVLLSQLNRETSKSGKPPSMHDLKESGDIENDSNEVILLYQREPLRFIAVDSVQLEYIEVWARIAKGRDCQKTGWPCDDPNGIVLGFQPKQTRFIEKD